MATSALRYFCYPDTPSVDAFRLGDHCNGLGTITLTCLFLMTDDEGRAYTLIRNIGLPNTSSSMHLGACRGSSDLDVRGDLAIPFAEHRPVEAYWVEETKDSVIYAGQSFRMEMGVDRFEWTDAGSRIEVSASRLSLPCNVHLPPQKELEYGFLDRSTLCRATGTIDGTPVTGMFLHAHFYSRPGVLFPEAEMTAKLDNYWLMWLVEYEDGEFEGGTAWQGPPGSQFSPAMHFLEGNTRGRSDARIDVSRTDRGTMQRVNLKLGSDLSVEFEQLGSFDWPLHTYGGVSRTSRTRAIARSWHYMENYPLNFWLVEQYQESYAHLHGRHLSLRSILDDATIEQESLVLPAMQPRSTSEAKR